MGCLGVHFALANEDLRALESIEDESERVDYLGEVIEEAYLGDGSPYAAASDKAWDAMHRLLADGQLTWNGGEYPLNHVVLGGRLLYGGDDYIMSLKTPEQVKEVAAAIDAIDQTEFRRRYDLIDADDYSHVLDDEDFEYTWDNFEDVRQLFRIAASEGRCVLFTASQ